MYVLAAADEPLIETGPVQAVVHQPTQTASARRAHIQLLSYRREGLIRWRLLSGNNRELGRGVRISASVAECLTHLAAVRDEFLEATTRIRRGPTGEWCWDVLVRGQAVASAGHGYPRLIRCQQALAMFAAAVAAAEVSPTPVDTSARRWAARRHDGGRA
jgi:hypothetical protein